MIQNFFKEIKLDNQFFMDSAQHIIDWNAKARHGITPEFTNEMFVAQLEFLREELKEYSLAAQNNDHVELLDAAADVFVVASYLIFMFLGKEGLDKILSTEVGDTFKHDVYDSFIAVEKIFEQPEQVALITMGILRSARDTLVRSVYNEKKVMKEVLKSNDSKYPTRKQLLDVWNTKSIDEALEKECAAIEERSKSREEGAYTGVYAVYNRKQKVYVFFDDKGKIQKPSTFVSPNIKAIVDAK